MTDKQSIAIRVAIQRPLYKLLDYSCDCDKNPLPGCRVRVHLGNYEITGIVVEKDIKSEFAELKPVIEVLDEKPLLDKSLLTLLDWASRYYFYPAGEVLFHALPNNLRKGKKPPQLSLWSVIQPEETNKGHPPPFRAFLDQLKRSPKQTQLFEFLIENGESDAIQFNNACGDNWRTSLNQLIKKEFVISREVNADYFPEKMNTIL